MTGPEFVRGVMERLGARTASDLAEAMGWKRGAERTAARWLAGETNPSFGYVMEMVERAGLLAAGGEVRPLEAGEDPPAPAERRQLAENDAAILENQNDAMVLLREILSAVATPHVGGRSGPTRSQRQ